MKREKENAASLNIIQEQVNVDKKIIETGKVLIRKKVHEEEKEIAVTVAHEKVKVTKVAVNKYVDTAPSVRYEGETTIIPVMKEVLVVEKKILLVEELHVTKHVIEKTEKHIIPLRNEEVQVEHFIPESKKDLSP